MNDDDTQADLPRRLRSLDFEQRLARTHSPQEAARLAELLGGPQRTLSSAEVERETQRLLAVCAAEGVEAVLKEVATCRVLLLSLENACRQSGRREDGEYLARLASFRP